METNIDKARKLVDMLLNHMADGEYFQVGGDVILHDDNGSIHLLFDGGDTDVVITFCASNIRCQE